MSIRVFFWRGAGGNSPLPSEVYLKIVHFNIELGSLFIFYIFTIVYIPPPVVFSLKKLLLQRISTVLERLLSIKTLII